MSRFIQISDHCIVNVENISFLTIKRDEKGARLTFGFNGSLTNESYYYTEEKVDEIVNILINKKEKLEKFNSFPERLVFYRKRAGLNQSQLAKFIGITSSQVSKYERGLVQPKPKTLWNIAAVLNIDTELLLNEA